MSFLTQWLSLCFLPSGFSRGNRTHSGFKACDLRQLCSFLISIPQQHALFNARAPNE